MKSASRPDQKGVLGEAPNLWISPQRAVRAVRQQPRCVVKGRRTSDLWEEYYHQFMQ